MIDLGQGHAYEPMAVDTRVITQDCNGPEGMLGTIAWARAEGQGMDVSTCDYVVHLDKIPNTGCMYYYWELRELDGSQPEAEEG